MKIRSLIITLQESYTDNPGKYIARVDYELQDDASTKIILDPEISTALMGYLGPVITQMSLKVAKQLEVDLAQSIEEAKRATALIEASV